MSIRVREERYMLLSLSVIFARLGRFFPAAGPGDTTGAIDNIDKAAFGPLAEIIPKILFDFFAPRPLKSGPLQLT